MHPDKSETSFQQVPDADLKNYCFLQRLSDEDRCEALILEGELLWKLKRYSESLISMIKSAKLNPNNWLSFFYMGKYYFECRLV